MNAPQLILRFGSNYRMHSARVHALHEIPINEVRAIYYADTMLIVETIDGKHMNVTSREIEAGFIPKGAAPNPFAI